MSTFNVPNGSENRSDLAEWDEKSAKCKLRISNEAFHNNARPLVSAFPRIADDLRTALALPISVKRSIRLETKKRQGKEIKTYWPGIESHGINSALRTSLSVTTKLPLHMELTHERDYFVGGKGTVGFDFAFIDEEHNLVRYRNACLGRVRYSNGEDRYTTQALRQLKIMEPPPGHAIANAKHGEDFEHVRSEPIILGEFQFGNWGLLYRDWFKALGAADGPGLDLFVYVCADGALHQLLSDGIVNFKESQREIATFEGQLRFPIWLIGVDVEFLVNESEPS